MVEDVRCIERSLRFPDPLGASTSSAVVALMEAERRVAEIEEGEVETVSEEEVFHKLHGRLKKRNTVFTQRR
jgi:hypothetical protein